jgi:hypothetical protein
MLQELHVHFGCHGHDIKEVRMQCKGNPLDMNQAQAYGGPFFARPTPFTLVIVVGS